jgi:hypothetical protein
MGDEAPDAAVPFPDAEESLARLLRAGWEIDSTRFQGAEGPVWVVSGHNGENQVRVAAPTREEAWWRACEAAQAVGMLGRPSLPTGRG